MRQAAPQFRPFLLLTGATGLVGGLVLALLLKRDIPVAVLARGNRRQSAKDRIESVMRRLEARFGEEFIRPVVLTGDLCSPRLGLSEEDHAWLTANCSSVIHSAANLLFRPASEHPNNEPFRTNVDGTRCLLDVLARAGISEFHYVSTAYLSGLRTGRIFEHESDVGQQFSNDYERSKSQSETMLRRSPLIASLTIYRPSIVLDMHPTANQKSDQTIDTAFSMFEALSKRFGLPERGEWFHRLGFGGQERKNIVTVDWVAAMITQIYCHPALHGKTYHLTSPHGTAVSELEDGFRAAVEARDIKLPPRRSEAMTLIDEQAAPFVAAFKPYFRDDPTFDRTNTMDAMAVCEESELPVLTVENLRDYCINQTKLAGLPVILKSEATAWSEFVRRFSEIMSAPVDGDSPAASRTGLKLCGQGGGQWLIEKTANGPIAYAASAELAPARWIAAAATFGRLLSGELSVTAALESGLLLFELDQPDSSPVPSPRWIDQMTSLLSEIHHHSQHILRSEVANVG